MIMSRSERKSTTRKKYESLQLGGMYTVQIIELIEGNLTQTNSRSEGEFTNVLGIES